MNKENQAIAILKSGRSYYEAAEITGLSAKFLIKLYKDHLNRFS